MTTELAHIDRTNPPLIMTSQEAAYVLGVTTESLLRWRKDGIGPRYCKPSPRVLRYLRDDLLAWNKESQQCT